MTQQDDLHLQSNISDPPRFSFPVQYDQGPEGGLILFSARCINCLTADGSYVAFSSNTPLPDGARVVLPKTLITSDNFLAGTQANVPAGWNTVFTVSFWSKQPPRPGLEISLIASYIVPPSQGAKHTRVLRTASGEDTGSGRGDSK